MSGFRRRFSQIREDMGDVGVKLVVDKPLACGPTRTSHTIPELNRGLAVTIEELITALYVHRYTGILTLDFRNGRPFFYALGRPQRGKIVVP